MQPAITLIEDRCAAAGIPVRKLQRQTWASYIGAHRRIDADGHSLGIDDAAIEDALVQLIGPLMSKLHNSHERDACGVALGAMRKPVKAKRPSSKRREQDPAAVEQRAARKAERAARAAKPKRLTFPVRLRAILEAAGEPLPQGELARRLGMTPGGLGGFMAQARHDAVKIGALWGLPEHRALTP